MVGGSLRVLQLLPPVKTGRHDIADILLKMASTHQKSIKINQFNSLLELKIQIPHSISDSYWWQGVDSVEMEKKEAFQFNIFAAYIII